MCYSLYILSYLILITNNPYKAGIISTDGETNDQRN